jgi:hypothetical protein
VQLSSYWGCFSLLVEPVVGKKDRDFRSERGKEAVGRSALSQSRRWFLEILNLAGLARDNYTLAARVPVTSVIVSTLREQRSSPNDVGASVQRYYLSDC